MKRELPFETLMDYTHGLLAPAEMAMVEVMLNEDPEVRELVDGLKSLYSREGFDSNSLKESFSALERNVERRIYLHATFSNHLTELNRQLRAAAAVFLLLFSCSLLTGFNSPNPTKTTIKIQHGPYDLALGSKIAP